MRVALSVMPPGVYGTIHLMGLLGHAWAWAMVDDKAKVKLAARAKNLGNEIGFMN